MAALLIRPTNRAPAVRPEVLRAPPRVGPEWQEAILSLALPRLQGPAVQATRELAGVSRSPVQAISLAAAVGRSLEPRAAARVGRRRAGAASRREVRVVPRRQARAAKRQVRAAQLAMPVKHPAARAG